MLECSREGEVPVPARDTNCARPRRCLGSSMSEPGRGGPLAMDYPSPQRDHANLSMDGSSLRQSQIDDAILWGKWFLAIAQGATPARELNPV